MPSLLWRGRPRAHLECVRFLPPEAPRIELATFAYRGLTIPLAVLSLVGHAAYLDALYWNALGLGTLSHGGLRPALLAAIVTSAVVSTAAAVLGVTMALRGDVRPGARPMGLALAVWAYLLAYSGIVVLLAPSRGDSLLRLAFEGHFLAVEALGLAALIRFTSVFPTPIAPESLVRPDTLPLWLRSGQHLRRWLLRAYAPWIAAALALALSIGVNAAMGRDLQDTALLALVDLFRLGALALVVLNLRHSFLTCDADGRTRLTWIVLGFIFLVGAVGLILGGNVLTAVTGWELPGLNWRPIVLNLGVLGLLWGAAMSVFYGGPVAPTALARRAAIMSGMAMLALFLAAGLEMLLSGVVAARFSLPYGAGTLLAAVAMALVYRRTRRPLDTFLSQTWGDPGAPASTEPREHPVAELR